MTKLWAAILTVAATLAVISPSAGAASPPKPATAAELAQAVQSAGWGCDDFEANDPANTLSIGNIPKGDAGHYTIDGERSEVTVYRTKADLAAATAAGPTLACSLGKSTGTTVIRWVSGSKWVISTKSSATAPKLAKALHAKAHAYNCKRS